MAKKKVEVGVVLSKGYFRSAQLSVEFLLSLRNIGKTSVPHSIKKIHPDAKSHFFLESGATFLAARFNFKHALELSMKSLFSTAGEDIPSGHDLEKICNDMKMLLGKAILRESFTAWQWIVKEYSANDKYAPKDAQNELDRYMFGMNGRKFPYTKIHSVEREDLKIFLRDIETAKALFWRMNGEHDGIKSCTKLGLDPEKELNGKSNTIICKLKNGRYITKRRANTLRNKRK